MIDGPAKRFVVYSLMLGALAAVAILLNAMTGG